MVANLAHSKDIRVFKPFAELQRIERAALFAAVQFAIQEFD